MDPDSAARIVALEQIVVELQTRLERLELAGSSSTSTAAPTTTIHVNLSGPSSSRSSTPCRVPDTQEPAPDRTASSAFSGGLEPPPLEVQHCGGGVFRRPSECTPVAGADSQVKHYSVSIGNNTVAGRVGVYRTFGKFADSVRDPEIVWSGRGKFSWAPGCEGLSFSTRREAEKWFREKTGAAQHSPIPYFG